MYSGYRIKINGIVVSNDFISQGSYSSQKEKRVLYEYYDANDVRHEELSNRERMIISFDIRERSAKEQQQLSGLWAQFEDVQVEYWDDLIGEYKSGIFKMDRPEIKHRHTRGSSIHYARTNISLREY